MRIVFMGTPPFAAQVMEKLIEKGHEIALVVTQPDKPKGRGQKLVAPAVKTRALELGLEVAQPQNAKDEEFLALLAQIKPEIIIVAAYGKILPKSILDLPQYGCLNVHASLLPKYRGAAPIQRAILDGEEMTGVTIMLMDVGLDTGKMLAKAELKIESSDNSGELFDKLAQIGAELLVDTLPLWVNGEIEPLAQDDDLASYASMLTKEEELIDWSKSAWEINRQIRAFAPDSCAYTYLRGKRLKIGASEVVSAQNSQAGTVIAADKKGIIVACGENALKLLLLQPEGKKMMQAGDFLNGGRIGNGERLGERDGE